MNTIYMITAVDKKAKRIVRGFSTIEKAKQFEQILKQLLWREIEIYTVYIDEPILD